MPAGPYGLPQGIIVDGQQLQAVPRKIGAYDMEGITTAANGVPSQLVYYQNATAFGQALTFNTSSTQPKMFGRDTNISSRSGGMGKGERLYAYGITAKVDSANTSLDSTQNSACFDQWRSLWAIADSQFTLGTDEFIRTQARDIPLYAPRVPQSTYIARLTLDISSEGMYDLTISGDPYVLDQQEDFRINLIFSINSSSFKSNAGTMLVETHFTIRLEGIRLKSLRQ